MRRMPTALAAATLAGLLTTGAALGDATLRLAQVTTPSGTPRLSMPPAMPNAAIMPPGDFGGSHGAPRVMSIPSAPAPMENSPVPAPPAPPEGPVDPDDQGGVRHHQ